MRVGGFIWGPARACRSCLAAFILLSACQGHAENGPMPGAPAASPAELVRQLGDKSFRTRRQAQRKLQEIGIPAKGALQAALNDPDAEIRFRVRQVLDRVLDLDFQQKLDSFLTQGDDCEDGCLPGWARYRDQVGDTYAARRLFVEMQRAERELLEAAQARPDSAGESLELRCQQLQHEMQLADNDEDQPLGVGSLAAFLFVAGNSQVSISTQAASYVNNFGNQPTMRELISAGALVEPLRQLLDVWVGRRFADTMVSYQNLQLAMRYNLKAALEPAAALAASKDIPPQQRPFALLALGKLGDKRQLPALSPLLNDNTEFTVHGRDGEEIRTQIADVALAVSVYLSGQPLRDYGFDHFATHSVWLFNPSTLGFKKSEDREKALAKWRAWEKSAE